MAYNTVSVRFKAKVMLLLIYCLSFVRVLFLAPVMLGGACNVLCRLAIILMRKRERFALL